MAPERDPRIAKAFKAMKSLGICAETVKPVLKRLLKLYDRNWELIEDDNYRTLADAIFECEDDKEDLCFYELLPLLSDFVLLMSLVKLYTLAEKNADMINEDPEPPSKKPHRGDPEDEVSSTEGNGKNIVNLEEGEVPRSSNGIRMVDSSQSVSVHRTSEPRHFPSEALYANHDQSDPDLGSTRNAIVPLKRKQSIEHFSQFVIPTSHTVPGSTTTSHHSDTRKKINGPYDHQTTYDIASSACGQVKVSLTCQHTILQHNSHFPSPDEVLNFAESMCRKFCKTVGDQFSVVKLLNELCESYKTGSNRSPGNNIHLPLRSSVHSIKKERLEGDLGKRVSSGGGSSSVSRDLVTAKKRVLHKISDITNGSEKVKISLLDETGNEDLPHYIYCPENITYESAYVHISLARIADDDCCSDCIGDCLSSSIPCACARDTGGEFAYTPEGVLSEKFLRSCISMKLWDENQPLFYCQDCPLERAKNADMPEKCKGHRLKKFIKECWRKCGCNMQCGNRVVQRGITRKLQVFVTSEGKGWGLRTLEELPEGAFICEYVGEILTNMELYERNKKSSGDGKHVYPVLLDADWATEGVLKDEEALCLDATHFGNVARFINHRCFDGNLIEIPVQVETPDRHYYHLAFFTKRKVDALEELTWDYEIHFDDDSHPIEAFKCLCGSKHCRDPRRKE
ncbi:hypothetical protein DH2020_010661 [Rehmannia glutinosa]|uniref:Histone-lysine N-methyltransferase n=1 Tax=Rehmannia glutinosa TaxID=99300 RepID=A0ABR0XB89_REHGL